MPENLFVNKTMLVTGASDGVGYATARRLVDDGAMVIVHASDQRRGQHSSTLIGFSTNMLILLKRSDEWPETPVAPAGRAGA